MNRSRTIVIGIEAAELRLVEQWGSEGVLPFLGSLLATCPLVSLRTPIHVLQVAVWPSLLTGASAGRHGQYVLWNQIRSGSYEMNGQRALRGSLRRYVEFLADRGITCALADIPADVRTPGFRGTQIVNWGTEYRLGAVETEPRDLASRIHHEVGPYPIPPRRQSGDSQPEHLALGGEQRLLVPLPLRHRGHDRQRRPVQVVQAAEQRVLADGLLPLVGDDGVHGGLVDGDQPAAGVAERVERTGLDQ